MKKLGIHWITLGLVAALGVFGLFAWEGDALTWSIWGAVVVVNVIYVVIVSNQKVSTAAHPNHHYPDICENCRPVQMHDGGPIKVMLWWYAAVEGMTREEAGDKLENMTPRDHAKVTDDHMRYLQRFPKP